MNKFRLILFVALALMGFANRGVAQDTFVPLVLYTNGNGCVAPLTNGQSLEAGQNYEMTASPAPGYFFSGWQPMNVFIITQTNFNPQGDPILPPIVSIVPSFLPIYTNDATLQFTMQAEMDVSSPDSNPSIVQAFGWQADFTSAPILQAISTNNTFQVTVTMQSTNFTTIVQASPDLVNWTNVCTNTPPFTFTNLMTGPACFYRAEVQTNGD